MNDNRTPSSQEMFDILESRQLNETINQIQMSRDELIVVRWQRFIKMRTNP